MTSAYPLTSVVADCSSNSSWKFFLNLAETKNDSEPNTKPHACFGPVGTLIAAPVVFIAVLGWSPTIVAIWQTLLWGIQVNSKQMYANSFCLILTSP